MLGKRSFATPLKTKGFTLVELGMGIVILAVALVAITGVLGPLYERSTDPWHQVRSAELGHSFMNEIMARSFDENSDRADGSYRCGANPLIETGAVACSTPDVSGVWPTDVGSDSRATFNDVDDFHGFTATGDEITNILAVALAGLYSGYAVEVAVVYDGNFDGTGNGVGFDTPGSAERLSKKITVTVTPPTGQPVLFTNYRSNW